MVLKGHSAVVLLFPRPRFVRNLNRVSDLRVPSGLSAATARAQPGPGRLPQGWS